MTNTDVREPSILCVGEILWDVFPDEAYLGGAPLNVAYHLAALGRHVHIASRLGDDPLAVRTRRRLAEIGLKDHLVQADPILPTGVVNVELINAHTPKYEIAEPAAWDAIDGTPMLIKAAAAARVIVFGSLAQRRTTTRQTIAALLKAGPAIRLFDANLRSPFYDRDLIGVNLQSTDVLKINDIEMEMFRDWFTLPAADRDAAETICERFGCRSVCLTRGANGAAMWHEGNWHEHAGYRVQAVDPVGAGDAFLAGLVHSLIGGEDAEDALGHACALGAFVASRASSCPQHDREAVNAIRHPAAVA